MLSINSTGSPAINTASIFLAASFSSFGCTITVGSWPFTRQPISAPSNDLPLPITGASNPKKGEIIATPGFDTETGIYLHMGTWQKFKKKKPTHDDAVAARQLLEDLVSEFPFTDDAARATWLAALLTALIRWSLRTAPFFGFDAPVMGSGKSLLGALIGCLVNGHDPAVMAQPKDENEAAKKIQEELT